MPIYDNRCIGNSVFWIFEMEGEMRMQDDTNYCILLLPKESIQKWLFTEVWRSRHFFAAPPPANGAMAKMWRGGANVKIPRCIGTVAPRKCEPQCTLLEVMSPFSK